MTLYTEIPTLRERAVAAALVIIGRIEKMVDSTIDYQMDQPTVRTTFTVYLETVLKGKIDTPRITIQVAGGSIEKVETPWSVSFKEGDRALLFLSPNYAQRNPGVYVPYLGSSYTVTANDDVELSDDAAKELNIEKYPNITGTLDTIIQIVKETVEQYEKEKALLFEHEPYDQISRPYPQIMEVPQPEFKGASPAAPENHQER